MFRASFEAWQVHFTHSTGKLASLTCKYDCLSVQELPGKSLRFAGVPLRDRVFQEDSCTRRNARPAHGVHLAIGPPWREAALTLCGFGTLVCYSRDARSGVRSF